MRLSTITAGLTLAAAISATAAPASFHSSILDSRASPDISSVDAAKPAIQKECGTECSDFIGFLDKCGQKRTDDAECKVDVEGICRKDTMKTCADCLRNKMPDHKDVWDRAEEHFDIGCTKDKSSAVSARSLLAGGSVAVVAHLLAVALG